MELSAFYSLIDGEIDLLVEEHKENIFLKKQNKEGKKSFGFLLWFLKQYSPGLTNIESYITDGNDDASCDIIFGNKDNFDKTVFYVIQSKWCIEANISGGNGMTKEIKACLSDFTLIAKGKKQESKINKNFNSRYSNLLQHISNGGETKFIFLSLAKDKHDAKENIQEFESSIASFSIIDINRLKRDYIELVYKGAKTHNPIETPYEPKGAIEIDFIEGHKITIDKPYTSHILLIKPKLIFDLFSKYGFALFYNNIRNPLHISNFNARISQTIVDNPLHFWYFNNGITAISDDINVIRNGSKKVQVKGLQIINGAQTVYSIYNAYNKASASEKNKIDSDTVITFRLLKSGGKEFDLNVTRYTNSQNPVNERDFHANDEVQIRLQNDFFDNTDVWYERRRGEFRLKSPSAKIISNEILAQSYLAYSVRDPLAAKNKNKLLFISERNDKEGLYEKIFNVKTKYDEMLVAHLLYEFIEKKKRKYNSEIKNISVNAKGEYSKRDKITLENEFILHSTFHMLTAFNVLLLKRFDARSVNGIVISYFKKDNLTELEKLYKTIIVKGKKYVKVVKDEDQRFTLTKHFKSYNSLDLIRLF